MGEPFVPRNGSIYCCKCSSRQSASCNADDESSVADSSDSWQLDARVDSMIEEPTPCRRAGITQNLNSNQQLDVDFVSSISEKPQLMQVSQQKTSKTCQLSNSQQTPRNSDSTENRGTGDAQVPSISPSEVADAGIQWTAENLALTENDLLRDTGFEDEMSRCIMEMEKLHGIQPGDYMLPSKHLETTQTKVAQNQYRKLPVGGATVYNSRASVYPDGASWQRTEIQESDHLFRHKCSKSQRYGGRTPAEGQPSSCGQTSNPFPVIANGVPLWDPDEADLSASTNESSKNLGVHFAASAGNQSNAGHRRTYHRLSGYTSDSGQRQMRGHLSQDGGAETGGFSAEEQRQAHAGPTLTQMSASVGDATPRLHRVPKLGIRQVRHAVSAAAVPQNPDSEAPLTPRVRATSSRVRTDGYYSDIDRESWRRQGRSVSGELGADGRFGYETVERYLATQNWDRCSTCSSSSDSEFDYYLDRPSGMPIEVDRWSRVPQTVSGQQQQHRDRKQKFNSKHCVVS